MEPLNKSGGALLTRGEAARLLGVTIPEIRRRERLGHLKAVDEDAHGWPLYREEDVAASCKAPPPKRGRPPKVRPEVVHIGGVPAVVRPDVKVTVEPKERYAMTDATTKAFQRLIDESAARDDGGFDGDTLLDIVQSLRLHPRIMEAIAVDFARLKGCILLLKPHVDALNRMPVEGDFPLEDAESVLKAVGLALQEAMCEACGKRPKKVCRGCKGNGT